MISIKEMQIEDLRVLLEGFDEGFLMTPLIQAPKSMQRYVPKGFRVNKLSKKQLIKVYLDAIKSNDIGIIEYIEGIVEENFEEEGVSGLIQKSINDDEDPAELTVRLTLHLLNKGFEIPAYIAMSIEGVECTETMKNISISLYDFFAEELENKRTQGYESGYTKGQEASQKKLLAEQKAIAKAKKALEEANKKKENLEMSLRQQEEWVEELEAELKKNETDVSQMSADIDRKNAIITQLENNLTQKETLIKEMKQTEEQVIIKNNQIKDKEEEIEQLKAEVEEARQMAYSERVLKMLCDDVIDEIKATSPSRKEILSIAKQRFTEEESICDAWGKLSDKSIMTINKIVSDFSDGLFDDTHLDSLESMEDDELIKLSTIKSLKAILYHSLEKKELGDSINSRFEGDTENAN